ncbi:hypothetical protein HM1_0018 [Heliomicrobium modesticaldum Ice1]|uniref:Trigger factor C-terminal domain-containing protein n=1 Tax=Heliobacterium modesticaldum (strain ATCC 51547 / Ice1) TaxID=498761 RepID=B0THX0_HELMI|nr:hypothetical protein [Heliomicrobium modesticaldum]ABZ82643.1 hypothetical protein HM1_0018 [Heliomicrobium modesticaldum Ice1]
MWKEVIKNKALYAESKKQKLDVSLDEAKQFALESAKAFETIEPSPSKAEAEAYLAGLELTPREYFEKVAPSEYQIGMSIGRLKAKLYEEKKVDPSSPIDVLDKVFDEYTNTIVRNAKVVRN